MVNIQSDLGNEKIFCVTNFPNYNEIAVPFQLYRKETEIVRHDRSFISQYRCCRSKTRRGKGCGGWQGEPRVAAAKVLGIDIRKGVVIYILVVRLAHHLNIIRFK
jgi:hypothetical protein